MYIVISVETRTLEAAGKVGTVLRTSTVLLSTLVNICDKCTKHQFIHLLTGPFKDLHIKNSKNHKNHKR